MSGSGSASVLEQVVPSSSVSAITIQETESTETEEPSGTTPTLLLKLTKPPKSDKKVDFQAGTVDNEHMNKKKSKCCCIYQKPTVFGESSSDSEDDCDHCSGHSGKKKKKNLNSSQDNQNGPEPADPVPV